MELRVRNVNDALAKGINYLLLNGVEMDSRNGKVIVAKEPVMTIYKKPLERVLFSPLRDANPFFHLMESLWMLSGSNNLGFPAYFNKRFEEYSDDGESVWGAYGWRWRKFFGYDQLQVIAHELRANPNSRRCVLSMWDGVQDLFKAVSGGKDVPCNTHAYFEVVDKKLNMTICCRSNDIIWGAYGANAVHFSILQEFMATYVGVEVGVYRQFSNNYHAYTDIYDMMKLHKMSEEARITDHYHESPLFPAICKPYKLISVSMKDWQDDLAKFMEEPYKLQDYQDAFFRDIAYPMYMAWSDRKRKTSNGLDWINKLPECDWKFASQEWINRREK